ncbi:MAG: glycine hydroxymethyltransferase [Deinococcus sp.]|nr:glycine hydroxymethyltransferase [Deinococcus sp.]
MEDLRQQISQLMAEHERWRAECVNLIAAENVASPAVRQYLSSDLAHRYGDYLGRDLHARKYFGNRYLVEIEQEVSQLAQEVFQADYVETRPLSGHVAGSAVIMSLTRPGALVMELGSDGGGHRLAEKLSVTPLTPLKVQFLPFDATGYNIATEVAIDQIRHQRPTLVILGSSNFLFPHPVRELAANLPAGTTLVYDASHVLGLIAGGQFQDPLHEGAALVFGSTHKTFPGPPGGIIFSQSKQLIEGVSQAIYPGLVTNHHPARSPALAMALLEMKRWGPAYARAIVQNAQHLGTELYRRDVSVVGVDQGFTRSHTLLLSVATYGSGKEVGACLEAAGIITNPAKLPPELGGEGVRIGVQELTRRGVSREQLGRLAELMAAVITRRQAPEGVRPAVTELAGSLGPLRYTWESDG